MESTELVYALEEIYNLLTDDLETVKKEFPKIRCKDEDILKHIWQNNEDHSIKMADLVTYLHVTPAAISQMVNTFELSGLVEKYKSQDDKRANYVALHPDLVSLVNKKKDILMDHAQAFHDSLSEEQQQSLSSILSQLVDYLQKNYVFYDGNEN